MKYKITIRGQVLEFDGIHYIREIYKGVDLHFFDREVLSISPCDYEEIKEK